MDPFDPGAPAPVPGYDGLYVRAIPASQAEEALDLFRRGEDGSVDETRGLIGLCILAVCDEHGQPRFTAADRERLERAPLAVVKACATAAMTLNGLVEAPEGN